MATRLEAQIESVKKQLADLHSKKRKMDARANEAKRKQDTRKKIIAGAWFLANATNEERAKMLAALSAKDKEVFDVNPQ